MEKDRRLKNVIVLRVDDEDKGKIEYYAMQSKNTVAEALRKLIQRLPEPSATQEEAKEK